MDQSEQRIPVAEERASVHKRTVETGRVRIRTVVDESEHWIRETLASDNVHVERIPVGREVATPPQIRHEGGTLVIPVVEEVLVVEKRLILKEEVHVRKERQVDAVAEPVRLKSTRAIVERDSPDAGGKAHDTAWKETS